MKTEQEIQEKLDEYTEKFKQKLNNAWNWVKSKWKQFLVVLGVGTILTASVVSPPIPQHLKLKATPERILNSRVVLQEKCVKWETNGTSTCEQNAFENIVKYDYISNEEVKQVERKGIKEDVSKRTGNAQFFLKEKTNKEETWVARFYSGTPFFYIPHENKWYQTKRATTTPDAFDRQTSSILGETALALSTTTYAGSGSGFVVVYNAVNWATARASASGDGVDYNTTESDLRINTDVDLTRFFYSIDTSVLPDTADISAGVLNLWIPETGYGITYQVGCELDIVQTSQVSTSELVEDDFNNLVFTAGGSEPALTFQSVGANGSYKGITMTATGRGWINKTGWTKIGVILNLDTDNTAPTSNNHINHLAFTGSAHDPYLEITYTISAVRRIIQSQIIE